VPPNRRKPRGVAAAFTFGGSQNFFDVVNGQIMLGNMLDVPERVVLLVSKDAEIIHPINLNLTGPLYFVNSRKIAVQTHCH
jgi:hypothetical protein